jgi:hypothetical protein
MTFQSKVSSAPQTGVPMRSVENSEAEVTRLDKPHKPSGSLGNRARKDRRLRLTLQYILLVRAHELGWLSEFGGLRRLHRIELKLSPHVLEQCEYQLWLSRNADVHLRETRRLWSQHGEWLNSYVRPAPPFRSKAKRRIGVGYRDKGSLPLGSSTEIAMANFEVWIYVDDIPTSLFFRPGILPSLKWEGDWCRIVADPELEHRLELLVDP